MGKGAPPPPKTTKGCAPPDVVRIDGTSERVNGQRTKGWVPFRRALLYSKNLRAQERIVYAVLEAGGDSRVTVIAASTGLTRHGVRKILKRLVGRGLVVCEAGRYRIGEVASGNGGGFVKAPRALLSNPELTPQEKIVWLAIRDAQDWKNAMDWTFVRPKTLAERLGLPRRSVALAMARLRAKGALQEHPDDPRHIRPALPARDSRTEPPTPLEEGNKLPTPSGQKSRLERHEAERSPLCMHRGAGRVTDCQGRETNCQGRVTNCQGEAVEMPIGKQKSAPPIDNYLENDLEREAGKTSWFSVRGEDERPGRVATPKGPRRPPETEGIPTPPTEVAVDRHPGRVVVTVNEAAAVEVRAIPRSFFHWIEMHHPFFADLVQRDMATRLRFMRKFAQAAEIEELADAAEERASVLA